MGKTHAFWVMIGLFCFCIFGWGAEDQDGSKPQDDGSVYEEVVVVAQKRPENIQDVPLSVSVVDRQTMSDAGIESVKQTSGIIPNLFVSGFAARGTSFPYLRGIGAGIGEPAVTTYVDGVPQLSSSTTDVEFLDIDRIEFLRGPQGALYGRNTLGGVIHYISREPSQEWSFDLESSLGESSHQRHRFSASGPLIDDRAFFRVGASLGERDGFTTNSVLGSDVDSRDSNFLKAQVRLTPSSKWKIDLAGYTQKDRDGGFTLYDLRQLRTQPHVLRHDYRGETRRDLTATSLTVEYAAPNMNIVSITAYETWDTAALTDLDFTEMELMHRQNDEGQHQFYQEVRALSSDAGQKYSDLEMGLTWLLGVSYFDSRFDHDSSTHFLPNLTGIGMSLKDSADYQLKDHGLGVFGQATLNWKTKTDLILGLRYVRETKRTDAHLSAQTIPPPLENDTLTSLEEEYDDWLPRLGITHRFAPHITAYATAAKGYRSGGYNRNLAPGGPYLFDQESNWTKEAGVKTHWMDHMLVANLVFFEIDWKDRQLEVPHQAIPGRYYLDNVGEAVSQGFEADFQAHLSKSTTLFGGLGYADATFEDYVDPNTGVDVSGFQLPYAPDLTWHCGGQIDAPLFQDLEIFGRAEIVGFGEVYFDNANTTSQDSYSLINLKTGLRWRGLSIEAWMHNAGDEEIIEMAIPSMFASSGYVGRNGEPRWAGMSLRYQF